MTAPDHHALPHPESEGDRLFHWRNLGDGKPVQVQECPMCGIAPANVDDCGRFGDPACPYFGVGKPEPEGPTDKEIIGCMYKGAASLSGLEPTWIARNTAECVAGVRVALARWGRSALKPVPVSERPWEREGWCDVDGRCWWGRPSEELCNSDWFLATRAEVEEFCDCFPPVVSLPHHALPVPEVTP